LTSKTITKSDFKALSILVSLSIDKLSATLWLLICNARKSEEDVVAGKRDTRRKNEYNAAWHKVKLTLTSAWAAPRPQRRAALQTLVHTWLADTGYRIQATGYRQHLWDGKVAT